MYTHLHGKATDDSERKPARNRADIGRRFPCGYNNKKTCSHSIQIYAIDDEIDKNNFANEKKRFCKNRFCISFLKRSSIFFRWGKKKIKFYQTSPFSQFILTLHLISKLCIFHYIRIYYQAMATRRFPFWRHCTIREHFYLEEALKKKAYGSLYKVEENIPCVFIFHP